MLRDLCTSKSNNSAKLESGNWQIVNMNFKATHYLVEVSLCFMRDACCVLKALRRLHSRESKSKSYIKELRFI